MYSGKSASNQDDNYHGINDIETPSQAVFNAIEKTIHIRLITVTTSSYHFTIPPLLAQSAHFTDSPDHKEAKEKLNILNGIISCCVQLTMQVLPNNWQSTLGLYSLVKHNIHRTDTLYTATNAYTPPAGPFGSYDFFFNPKQNDIYNYLNANNITKAAAMINGTDPNLTQTLVLYKKILSLHFDNIDISSSIDEQGIFRVRLQVLHDNSLNKLNLALLSKAFNEKNPQSVSQKEFDKKFEINLNPAYLPDEPTLNAVLGRQQLLKKDFEALGNNPPVKIKRINDFIQLTGSQLQFIPFIDSENNFNYRIPKDNQPNDLETRVKVIELLLLANCKHEDNLLGIQIKLDALPSQDNLEKAIKASKFIELFSAYAQNIYPDCTFVLDALNEQKIRFRKQGTSDNMSIPLDNVLGEFIKSNFLPNQYTLREVHSKNSWTSFQTAFLNIETLDTLIKTLEREIKTKKLNEFIFLFSKYAQALSDGFVFVLVEESDGIKIRCKNASSLKISIPLDHVLGKFITENFDPTQYTARNVASKDSWTSFKPETLTIAVLDKLIKKLKPSGNPNGMFSTPANNSQLQNSDNNNNKNRGAAGGPT